jgi:hypothetical protein
LWVHAQFRHQHIATQLLDAARIHSIFGMTIPKHQIAMSSPTQAGWAFAKDYCSGGVEAPLVYDYTTTATANAAANATNSTTTTKDEEGQRTK